MLQNRSFVDSLRKLWVVAVLSLLATVVGVAGAPEQAAAQACSGTSYSASTGAEFNAAITCFNTATSPASYEIAVLSSFGSPTVINGVSFETITQQTAGFELVINGNGNTITGNSAASVHGLILDTGPNVVVEINELAIDLAADTALVVQGSSSVFTTDLTLSNAGAVGVVVRQDASATLLRSLIVGSSNIGLLARDQARTDVVDSQIVGSGGHGVLGDQTSFTRIVNSTIVDSGLAGVTGQQDGVSIFASATAVISQSSVIANLGRGVTASNSASILVSNSTLSENSIGGFESFSNEDSAIANSTVVRNGPAGPIGSNISTFAAGDVDVISSIVGPCANGNLVVDQGFNVGDCFGAAVGSIGLLANNSCVVGQRSPSGITCAPTLQPIGVGGGFGQGSCTDPNIFFLAADFTVQSASAANPVPIDQRGFLRPQGGQCDVGALESAASLPADDSVTLVAPNDITVDVLANDMVIEPIVSITTTTPSQGTVTVNADLSVTYTPGVSTFATDSFMYTACDQLQCQDAMVNISITRPVCDGQTATIWGTAGPDTITGTSASDVIVTFAGDDVVSGGDGNDRICTGAGLDIATGDDGNDRMFGGADSDVLRGGPGVDHVVGNGGDDRLLGGIGGDFIDGGPGNDFLGGFGGDDVIVGGGGDDRIFGGFGADQIDAGDGNDRVSGLVGNDVINGGTGNDDINGDRGNDTINGGDGDDIIKGGNADDVINGGNGNDDIKGGKADDTMSGGPGVDSCVGNLENNADSADGTCETILGVP